MVPQEAKKNIPIAINQRGKSVTYKSRSSEKNSSNAITLIAINRSTRKI